jgi:Icc-related predicted phosphoesterase
MIVLALGDPHGKLPKNLDKIIKKNKIDLIICVGDIPYSPEKHWLEESWKGIKYSFVKKSYVDYLDKLSSYGLPVLILRGNMWLTGYKKKANKIIRKNKNIINKWTGKWKRFGENFIFFDVHWEKKGDEPGKITKRFLRNNSNRRRKLNEMLKQNPHSILITHNPPRGVLDKNYAGKHVGSKIIADAIKKYQPKVVFCGHIHEAKGKGKIGKTLIYNLGERGDYGVFEINEKKVKLIESNFLK